MEGNMEKEVGRKKEGNRKQELRKLVRLQVSGLNHEYCIQTRPSARP